MAARTIPKKRQNLNAIFWFQRIRDGVWPPQLCTAELIRVRITSPNALTWTSDEERTRKNRSLLGRVQHSLSCLTPRNHSKFGRLQKKKHMDILIPIRLSASPLSLLVCLSVKMRDVRAEGPCQMERGPTPPQVPSTQRFRRRPSKHIHRIQRVNSINTGRRGPHIRRTGCAVSSWGPVT